MTWEYCMFLKSWPADQVEGLHVAAFSSEVAAAAEDPAIRARDKARSIIVASLYVSSAALAARRRVSGAEDRLRLRACGRRIDCEAQFID